MHASPSPWILSWETPAKPAFRIFLFPHAGGGASAYRSWPRKLPSDVAVHAIQPPGREQRFREPPVWRMETLIDELLPCMLPLLDRPFLFFGHSLGAKVAHAACHALDEAACPQPEALLVSACRPPHFPEPRPLHALPDTDFLRELARFQGTDPAVLEQPELLRCFLPMLRADFTMDETWNPKNCGPLSVPIHAFCARSDNEAHVVEMRQWKRYTSTDFTLSIFPGGHFYLRTSRELPHALNTIFHNLRTRHTEAYAT
ncbi:thioesterase II family protein [Desulfobotulus sp.]|uniref:thioesterase II family protein n=1 Tax=Desulfobotulus sp. TaxID=1940337 RepID=UPI002A3719F2|nr:alpha/beta fold hydrolase [Desulfobotulus sp.]MDY0163517.1 alpha/beta fold hydrolase [Desulfobotulus sp.]